MVLRRVGEGNEQGAESVSRRLRLLVVVALGGGVGVCMLGAVTMVDSESIWSKEWCK